MRAVRPPLLAAAAAVSLLAITAAATASTAAVRDVTASDVDLLRAMQKEDGNIDRLILDILRLQEAKELAEVDRQSAPQRDRLRGQLLEPLLDPRWYRQGDLPGERSHAVRHFAYYPSDLEYYLPRLGDDQPVHPAETKPPDDSGQRIKGEAEAVSAVPVNRNFQDGAAPKAASTDRADMPTNDIREKRRMTGVNLAGRTAAFHGPHPERDRNSDVYFIVTVVGVCTGTVCVSILGGIYYRYLQQRRRRSSSESGYPSYGVTGPHSALSPASTDRKLAQSAQLYHYQHQKQHMMAIQEGKSLGRCSSPSDENSDGENDESEHTVYECPGLAPNYAGDASTGAAPVSGAFAGSRQPSVLRVTYPAER